MHYVQCVLYTYVHFLRKRKDDDLSRRGCISNPFLCLCSLNEKYFSNFFALGEKQQFSF